MYFIIILFIAITNSYISANIVQTNYGPIEGKNVTNDVSGNIYFSFEGVRYAVPPLGKLRFQPPQKPTPWTEVRDSRTKGAGCMQERGGSEDCLYLNVFTPSLPNENETQLLPVMVYVHGGAFVHGCSAPYNPEYLIDKNIVLVTFNYRLNIFGFLNARDESAQGNAGLKDQVAALHWVQENIQKFNGDPNQVTIFGHSAGGVSVNYLILSKLATGLFHRAIIQSGSVLNEFALNRDPTSIVYKLGDFLECKSKNIKEIVEFLQNVPSQKLLTAAFNKKVVGDYSRRFTLMKLVPSLENDVPGAFITENSYSVIVDNKISNHVPTIIGYTSGEAGFFLEDIKSKDIDITYYSANPNYLVPETLNIINDTDKLKKVTNEILDNFFENDTNLITNENFIKYQSQNIFGRAIRKTIELLKPHMDLYFYKFVYKNQEVSNEYDGVPHADELKYLFYKFHTSKLSSEDDQMVEKMVTLWTNFAKFGNPTPDENDLKLNITWPKISKIANNEDTTYLSICKILKIEKNPNERCYMFWENLFKNYGNPPFFGW